MDLAEEDGKGRVDGREQRRFLAEAARVVTNPADQAGVRRGDIDERNRVVGMTHPHVGQLVRQRGPEPRDQVEELPVPQRPREIVVSPSSMEAS